MSVFSRFPARLQQAISARLGWTVLRPVQEEAGEAILDGKNAVVLAPTAGGKTEAAMFPVLANLVAEPSKTESVRAIYIAPIKALLNNQAERLGLYTEMVGLERFLWHGDVGPTERKHFLREPTDLLMTTPESLEVMLVSQKVPTAKLFTDLRYVIIDEVHAMAGVDRGAHLMSVLERIARFTDNDVQRIGLSATVGNPDAILEWLKGTSKREGVVIDPPKPPASRKLMVHLDASVGHLADRAAEKATVGRRSAPRAARPGSRRPPCPQADRPRRRGRVGWRSQRSGSDRARPRPRRDRRRPTTAAPRRAPPPRRCLGGGHRDAARARPQHRPFARHGQLRALWARPVRPRVVL